MKQHMRLCCLIMILCLMLSFAACNKSPSPAQEPTGTPAATETGGTTSTEETSLQLSEPMPAEALRAAKDYDEIKDYLLAASSMAYQPSAEGGMTVFNGFDSAKAEEAEAVGDSADYSETNVQVEGIDEADVVKTDGKNIYAMFGSVVQIISAEGSDTALLSEIFISADSEESNVEPRELYVDGSRLIVLSNTSTQISDWEWSDETEIRIYDVSDPTEPKLDATVGQDGYYQTSRLTDGRLYVATLHFFYDEPGEDWIPCTYRNGEAAILPAENFYLAPDCQDTSFTLFGAYDCGAAELTDVCSFTGSCDTVYMSSNYLYLAQTSLDEQTSEPYTEDQYDVTDYKSQIVTRIHRISFSDGKLTPTGTGTVSGSMNNQFSMDEYDGMLRVAATTTEYARKIYTDEKHGFVNYADEVYETNNAVYILDADMNKVGSVEDLVKDEQIYSVRFMGKTAYVVTYEQVDPVFTIDLSDPADPTVQSALELTGVSHYLQSYGDGLLFGFGEALDENASSQGLQLNMFDVSDPKNVTLKTRTVIEDWGSEALYNHKALLADPQKNLIMFPGGNEMFYVYSYENGAFTEKGSFELGAENESQYWYWAQSRGLYIGNYLYLLCDQVVFVVDLNSFETVRVLSLAEG